MSETIPKLDKPRAEWRDLLSSAAYAVLFEAATEPAGSSELNQEKRDGTFVCAACHLSLFDSASKYESGTGWPSFFARRSHMVNATTQLVSQMVSSSQEFVEAGR